MSRRLTVMLLVSVLAWLAPSAGSAQTAIVAGIVRAADGEPLAGATVVGELMSGGRMVNDETDSSGRFAFVGLASGQWLFTVGKLGYEPAQGIATLRQSGRSNMSFVLNVNPFDPPVPATGVLGGLRAGEIQRSLAAAHALFDAGDFDAAIDAYEVVLERIPQLTSLNLQIGHAYQEKRNYQQALAAYRAVPADSPAAEEAASAIQALTAPAPGR